MKIALFGKNFSDEYIDRIRLLIEKLVELNVQISIFEPFAEFFKTCNIQIPEVTIFNTSQELKDLNPKVVVSIGGDGTILQAAAMVMGSKIPILGINTGRLGFLSSISIDEVEESIDDIINIDYVIDKRSLLELKTKDKLFGNENFALNELAVSKRDTSSMIMTTVYLNDEYLNTYWSDGLIVSTPTGSTAYSLSGGGPIVMPDSNNLIITPIAPHNLNVRPLVIADTGVLRIKVEGRADSFLATLDSRTSIIKPNTELIVKKHPHQVYLVRLPGHSYLTTLRNKLNWGADKRN